MINTLSVEPFDLNLIMDHDFFFGASIMLKNDKERLGRFSSQIKTISGVGVSFGIFLIILFDVQKSYTWRVLFIYS